MNNNPTHRPLHVIANEVRTDWSHRVNFAAKPYLNAMLCLDSITDTYGADDAKSVVLYFLSNASTWRGDTARRVKAELKAMCK